MLLIEKDFSGLSKDINIDYLESNWSLLDKDYNLNYLLSLENIDNIESINKKYRKMLRLINSDYSSLDMLLGNNRIKDNLKELKNKINIFKSRFNKRYEKVFNIRQELVSKISTSFLDNDDYIIPVYDNHSSVTGRTKITSGYNFLVMKKADRKKINSRHKGGRIYEIDIVSLEPRIACKIIRNEEYDDIYNYISNNVLSGKHDRKNVKLGLISTLYGAKSSTVKKLAGLNDISVKKIKDWFDISNLYDRLNEEYQTNNKITNYYGRNVYSQNALINHYIQSSSVDSAMIGFNNFISNQQRGVDLIAIIHDAIIIDVHPDQFKNIEDTYFVYDDILNMNLPVKIERLS